MSDVSLYACAAMDYGLDLVRRRFRMARLWLHGLLNPFGDSMACGHGVRRRR